MKYVYAVLGVLTFVSEAKATPLGPNVLAGPVVGWRIGEPSGPRFILGVEGGVGVGPERVNLGFESRYPGSAWYLTFNPWFVVGGTVGMAWPTDQEMVPVLGVWEGDVIPMSTDPDADISGLPCEGWHFQSTLSLGYRFMGGHEIYLAPKVGVMKGGGICYR